MKAVNTIEEFRLRIEGDQIAIYDHVGASSTVPRPDGTFGFSYMPFKESFQEFYASASAEIERVANSTGLEPSGNNEHVVHYSTLPWINFTSLSHARHYATTDSVPKVSFGKLHDKEDKKVMPMSIHAHHALMDGYHVGKYIELFQELMNTRL
ncbi:chloramphenicol acetyltransferase [Fulvivirga imtechensis AK7]|uniref:Chloramphenicol acetyltransferase n=1 Tax=Fulvivirga imtechensis AK7 TaxID=1237149 RepID=L8JP28_9BACT|nr:chloramphenicol acetyltransferase [Fulvivirga imtechensis AK7]